MKPATAVTADEAVALVLATVQRQPPLRMPLVDALGHVLADDVPATIPLPPWTNAAMDGYAVRAADVRGASAAAPATLRIVGTSVAGGAMAGAIGPGETMRIFTGAAVPVGADSVIRQEDTIARPDTVMIRDSRDAGHNVRTAGGDLAAGALALSAGTELGSGQLALLAALGVAHPLVHRRPRVGILATGDELVGIDDPEPILSRQRLADVNGPALAAAVVGAGGSAVPLGIVPDRPEAIAAAIDAARDVDLVLTAGGVSVGDRDFLHLVTAQLGVTELFGRVRMRPGGPTSFGRFPDGRCWLGLPGNPVSALVAFTLFGRPAIRAMAGHRRAAMPRFTIVMDDIVGRDATLELFLRVTLSVDGERPPRARLTGPQGSGMLTSIARADALAVVAPGSGATSRGEALPAIPW